MRRGGGGGADDDSLPGKVKAFFQKNPQHYPKTADELRQDVPDSQIKVVQDGIGASETDPAVLKKAIKAAYGKMLKDRERLQTRAFSVRLRTSLSLGSPPLPSPV